MAETKTQSEKKNASGAVSKTSPDENANNEMSRRESQDVQRREQDNLISPFVDIYEDDEGITLKADMPGVSKEGLILQVDKNSLTVEGEAKIDTSEDMKALYADVRSTRYKRGFTLSSELDTDSIDASLKDGVLNIRIPKRAELKPRRIEVQSA